MKFANPRNDIAFKKIFGDENKKEILISFLNAVLDFTEDRQIADVTIVNPYQVPKIEELKETILDIKALNRKKEHFIVEMQKKDLGDFSKRSLYYTSKAYVQQLDKGKNYNTLKKVYFIGICNFKIFDNIEYISRHLIINHETMKNDLSDFEFTFIELPKFQKELNELETIIDKWTYFIKKADKEDYIPKELNSITEINEAYEIITQYKWDKREMEIYDYILKNEMDEANALMTAENKGIRKGLEQGLEQGKKLEKIQIAKNLLLAKIDIKTISLSTDLTIEEIENIKETIT
jgi:predicted transposase/invertase (TIGR01784 family)